MSNDIEIELDRLIKDSEILRTFLNRKEFLKALELSSDMQYRIARLARGRYDG